MICPGKTPEQVIAIVARLSAHDPNVLATRCDPRSPPPSRPPACRAPITRLPRLLVVRPEPTEGVGLIVVAAAGTADLPWPRSPRS